MCFWVEAKVKAFIKIIGGKMEGKELKEITQDEFNEYIYGKDGMAVLFLYLQGDKHSVEAEPVMERLNKEFENDLTVYKINGEKNELLMKGFLIRALPSLVIFDSGRLMDIKTGVGSYEGLLKFIRRTTLI